MSENYEIHTDVKFQPLELVDIKAIADSTTQKWFNQSLCKVNDCVVRLGVVHGQLKLTGNGIRSFETINFHNAEKTCQQTSPTTLQWESLTTGGVAGVVIELAKPTAGRINLHINIEWTGCDNILGLRRSELNSWPRIS